MEKENYIRLIIKSFKANENLELCEKYTMGYSDVLKSYGAPLVLSRDVSWYSDPDTYAIIMVDQDTGTPVGGARVQIYNQKRPLLIEKAIGDKDPKVYDYIKNLSKEGTGEICRVWNSKSMSGTGLSQILIRTGVAESCIVLANQLKLNSLVGLCAPWTVNLCKKVGYVEEKSVGNNGTFLYPKEDLIATLMVLPDIGNLNHAEEVEKNKISSLIKNPNQVVIEEGKDTVFEIEYHLKLSSAEFITK